MERAVLGQDPGRIVLDGRGRGQRTSRGAWSTRIRCPSASNAETPHAEFGRKDQAAEGRCVGNLARADSMGQAPTGLRSRAAAKPGYVHRRRRQDDPAEPVEAGSASKPAPRSSLDPRRPAGALGSLTTVSRRHLARIVHQDHGILVEPRRWTAPGRGVQVCGRREVRTARHATRPTADRSGRAAIVTRDQNVAPQSNGFASQHATGRSIASKRSSSTTHEKLARVRLGHEIVSPPLSSRCSTPVRSRERSPGRGAGFNDTPRFELTRALILSRCPSIPSVSRSSLCGLD